jgi:hypothetical protein
MRRWINANRWFVAVTVLVFLCALCSAPLLGAGWFWGLGNGLGLAALSCLAWLCLDTRRGGKISHHQQLGYWASALLIAHIAWFLLGDTTTWQYLKTSAPAWMWSGWLALLLILVLIISSVRSQRAKAYAHHPGFRRWHRLLTATALGASVHHLCGSGFYFREWYQWCLLTLILAGCFLLPIRKARAPADSPIRGAMLCLAVAVALFVGIKNLTQ